VALTEVNLPNSSLKSIGTCAFAHCIALTRIFLPNSVAEIQEGAFYCCSSLAIVRLPKNPSLAIADYAFRSCDALTTVEVPRMELAVWPHFLEQFNSNRLFSRIGVREVRRKTCAFSFLRKSAPQLFEDRKLPGVVRRRVMEEVTTGVIKLGG
jgi:hypothetical protein